MRVSAGRSGKRWIRLKANVRARRDPCCRCHQRIDYSLEYPHPGAFTVDHFPYPRSTHPWLAEEPSNLAAAHASCNWGAGNDAPKPTLGTSSEDW